jgi:hypothetical protein
MAARAKDYLFLGTILVGLLLALYAIYVWLVH